MERSVRRIPSIGPELEVVWLRLRRGALRSHYLLLQVIQRVQRGLIIRELIKRERNLDTPPAIEVKLIVCPRKHMNLGCLGNHRSRQARQVDSALELSASEDAGRHVVDPKLVRGGGQACNLQRLLIERGKKVGVENRCH